MDLNVVYASFCDELEKIKLASELTEAAREHIKSKNFAVSAKASNTGKPAYPIPDKAHARAALGFAAMHRDKKDLAEVRKDVEKKFPGMVQEKKSSALEHATELAGLGVLAVPGVDTLQAKMRSGDDPEHWKKKLLLGEDAHAAADVGGLGILAAPEVSKLLRR